jgi:nucleoside-diphosphate-sugar epimerase
MAIWFRSMEINIFQNKHLLVVGGSGFIGRHIVKKALEEGLKTVVLSKNIVVEDQKKDGVEYLNLDISDKSSLSQCLLGKQFDYVINLGGYINHENFPSGGDEIYDVHFAGVRNLADSIDLAYLKGFIQIGSSDEYGSNLAPQIETQREAPFSAYSCAKVASTHYLQTRFKTEKFPAIILRPFLVYGPGQNEDRFIPQIIMGCINDQSFSTSKGEQLRDFCYIDDFTQAVFAALKKTKAHGEVINICSGIPVTIKSMIEKIVSLIGSGRPQFGKIHYRVGENMALYGDPEKAKRILNWEAKTSLDEGLARTIEWLKNINNA